MGLPPFDNTRKSSCNVPHTHEIKHHKNTPCSCECHTLPTKNVNIEPPSPEPWVEVQGLYVVNFLNGTMQMVDVQFRVTDSYGKPLYLQATDGTLYNFQTIISIKKVD